THSANNPFVPHGLDTDAAIDPRAVVQEAEYAAARGVGRALPSQSSVSLLNGVATLVARLVDSGVTVDPMDVVYPARLCGRLALWSLSTPSP
ncbi:MAG TPA: hypothetical protein VIO38_09740, partial [Rariglobus sp.]